MKRVFTILFLLIIFFTELSFAQVGKWRRILDAVTYDIAVNPLNYNTLYAGGDSYTMYRSWDQGKTWDTLAVNSYQGGASILNNVIVHPIDTGIVLVGGISFNDIRRSTDCGNTWKIVLGRDRSLTLNGKSLFFKPDDPNYVYAGEWRYGTVFRSTNKGETWDSISTVMRHKTIKDSDGNPKDTIEPAPIGSFSSRDDSTNILFANTTDGEIYISKDGGFNWAFADTLVKAPIHVDCEITRLCFSEKKPLHGYCVITYLFFGNKPNGGLYKTTDGGYNWDLVAFTDTSMWAVAVRGYGDEDEVFIGGYTEDFYTPPDERVIGVGLVRRSQDGGKTWWSYDEDMDWLIENKLMQSNINSISFVDPSWGYVVGQNGVVKASRDNGIIWEGRDPGAFVDLLSSFFVETTIGFATSYNGTILKTLYSGYQWDPTVTPTTNTLRAIFFTDSLHGYSGGDGGVLLKSVNYGENWTLLPSPINKNLYSMFFTDSLTGYAVGDSGTIIKTTNGGSDWITQNGNTNLLLKNISFVDKNSGFISGDNGLILKTTNGGDNWLQLITGTNKILNGVHFVDLDTGLAVGKDGLIIRTTDGGINWEKMNSTITKFSLNGIGFHTKDTGCVVGDDYNVLLTKDCGRTWKKVVSDWGPRANVWSQRFFGPPGNEKLYMATEAGLFVLDFPSPVPPESNSDLFSNLFVTQSHSNLLLIKYQKKNGNSENQLIFRMINLIGEVVFEKNIANNFEDIIQDNLIIPELPSDVYICQMIDGTHSSYFKIVID